MSGNCPKCNSALVNFDVPTNTQVSEKFKHSKQNLSPSATDKAVLGGVLLVAVGIFILFHTFELFFQDQAVLFLKNASPFTKAEHPTLFVFCSIINTIIGLASLGGGVRFFFRSISKNDIHP
ncbi:MAG: hypothetical protein Q7T83_10195 [Thermodesulfovibrionales bacterium]|nr:hypothetical protein [Thermodesulfovibrionales bacterium]